MCFVGEGQELTVTTTVTKGGEMISRTIGIEGEDTTHLLLTIAVGSKEAACETAVDNLYLSAKNLYHREKRLYPVIDARTDNKHLSTFR